MGWIMLIRHGESEANTRSIISEDIDRFPLTENGIRQAEFTGKQLSGITIDNIYTSPVKRAVHTAEIIGEIAGFKAKIENRIRESGFGSYNNRSIDFLRGSNREALGMEPWSSIVSRMIDFATETRGNVVAVSHSLPIRALIASVIGMNEVESFGIEVGYASFTVIDIKEMKVKSIGSRTITGSMREYLLRGSSGKNNREGIS
jgi:probable phosphoglycerate mutase